MKNRLSHSAVSVYQTCPKKYYYQYKEKLRDKYSHAALMFGSAIDEALNKLLGEHGSNDFDFTLHTYKTAFTNAWREGWVNKKKVSLYQNELLAYANADFDGELLAEKDRLTLSSFLFNAGIHQGPDTILEFYETLKEQKETKGFDSLSLPLKKFYNYANWICLHHKGILMIEAYYREFVSKVLKKVLAVQVEMSLDNGEGDTIIMYVDAVVELNDGRIVVLDNKTSARDYESDAVVKSPQLTLYFHTARETYNATHAGFAVLKKQINKQRTKKCTVCGHTSDGRAKTCDKEIPAFDKKGALKAKPGRCDGIWDEKIDPKVEMQILIDQVPERAEEIVLENYIDINTMIKTQVYPRNLSACELPFKCPYRDLCWKNNSDGLVKVE